MPWNPKRPLLPGDEMPEGRSSGSSNRIRPTNGDIKRGGQISPNVTVRPATTPKPPPPPPPPKE